MTDFEAFCVNGLFNVGDTVGERRCITVNILSDGEEEDPEEFFVLIFIATLGAGAETDPEREVKVVTITDGEYFTIVTLV